MSKLIQIQSEKIKMDPIFERFEKEIFSFSSLTKGDSILVSVSSGLDSMALLSLLVSSGHFDITVAHINHHLRQDSDQDESLVKAIAENLKITFECKSLNPDEIESGVSIEQWGRNHRYQYLNKLVVSSDINWIMTAHHGNDQAETLLMNLSRQTGLAGLRGVGKEIGKVLRPLLKFSKQELSEFVKRQSIPYREDLTNNDLSIPRNFMRHRVVKPWEKEIPSLLKGIQGSIEHFIEWMDALDHFIDTYLISKVIQSDNQFEIPLEIIETMPNMTKVRLVQNLFKGDHDDRWSKHQIEQLKHFFQNQEIGHYHTLHNGWKLLRDRYLIIGEKMAKCDEILPVELVPNHPVEFIQFRYELNVAEPAGLTSSPNLEKVDWSILKDQKLEIRTWSHGDIFQPLGMEGHQKISDFLTHEKVDLFQKESQAVLTANGTIAWVCGRRIADWVKLTPNSTETAILNRSQLDI